MSPVSRLTSKVIRVTYLSPLRGTYEGYESSYQHLLSEMNHKIAHLLLAFLVLTPEYESSESSSTHLLNVMNL